MAVHVEGVLRQMGGGMFYRCNEHGHPLRDQPFGSDDSYAKFHAGQTERVDDGAVVVNRGPYSFQLKPVGKGAGQVTYVTVGGSHWVREGPYEDFEKAGFQVPAG